MPREHPVTASACEEPSMRRTSELAICARVRSSLSRRRTERYARARNEDGSRQAFAFCKERARGNARRNCREHVQGRYTGEDFDRSSRKNPQHKERGFTTPRVASKTRFLHFKQHSRASRRNQRSRRCSLGLAPGAGSGAVRE